MAEDERLIITAAEAESLLPDGAEHVHNMSAGRVMIGADWDRAGAIATFKEAARIEIGGEFWKGIAHPIGVLEPSGRFSFFEADMAAPER